MYEESISLAATDADRLGEAIEQARSCLGPSAFETVYAHGTTMADDQARDLAEALALGRAAGR